ncbi:MAG: hypothetical protein ABIH23_02430 [bacterium]
MVERQSVRKNEPMSAQTVEQAVPYGSNEIRLSLRQWVGVFCFLIVFFAVVPIVWNTIEPFSPDGNYRIPEELSYDYWLFNRYARWACRSNELIVFGDSVIWGQYVQADQTLSSYLNREGSITSANCGVNGTHPAALEGLIRYYGRSISGRKTILHCNLLWMSSEQHDLQTDKEFHFNHPDLVPQFIPRIPCYKEKYSHRLGVVIGRAIPFFAWAAHLRIACFGSTDIPNWTIENPYRNPARAILNYKFELNEEPRSDAVPWTEKNIPKQNLQWVSIDSSVQWRSFRNTVDVLSSRQNNILVVLGPFNIHMLTDDSLQRYHSIRKKVIEWMEEKGVEYYAPSPLPSDYYADASHPLAEGYEMLASDVVESKVFQRLIKGGQ